MKIGPAVLDRLWFGDDALARAARLALSPLEGAYSLVVGAREALYDAAILRGQGPELPTISVGNLTVGGTGKTPVAAWIAAGLHERGARPAIVLRGYGEDEPLVHRVLNPEAVVVVDADRARGVARARDLGADVAVLDDAFQHRRVRRNVDVVLVSADRWTDRQRMLPAGPWREPLRAVRRASLIVVTRKAAAPERVAEVHDRLSRIAPAIPRVSIHLMPDDLVRVGGDGRESLSGIAGRHVRVITAIADPAALAGQLAQAGATVTMDAYPDHHRFTDEDIARFVEAARGVDRAVCTLKDAVKIADRWPRAAPPLWYVSQRVTVERGVGGLERVLDDLVSERGRSTVT